MPKIILTIASLLERIPFPNLLGQLLRYAAGRVARIHRWAPFVLALILGYLAAEIILGLARLPLYYLWSFFGWVSGNDVSSLSVYNAFAHILAFIVALKVAFESQRGENQA